MRGIDRAILAFMWVRRKKPQPACAGLREDLVFTRWVHWVEEEGRNGGGGGLTGLWVLNVRIEIVDGWVMPWRRYG